MDLAEAARAALLRLANGQGDQWLRLVGLVERRRLLHRAVTQALSEPGPTARLLPLWDCLRTPALRDELAAFCLLAYRDASLADGLLRRAEALIATALTVGVALGDGDDALLARWAGEAVSRLDEPAARPCPPPASRAATIAARLDQLLPPEQAPATWFWCRWWLARASAEPEPSLPTCSLPVAGYSERSGAMLCDLWLTGLPGAPRLTVHPELALLPIDEDVSAALEAARAAWGGGLVWRLAPRGSDEIDIVRGCSLGGAALAGVAALREGRAIRADVVVIAAADGERLRGVAHEAEKIEAAYRAGARRVVLAADSPLTGYPAPIDVTRADNVAAAYAACLADRPPRPSRRAVVLAAAAGAALWLAVRPRSSAPTAATMPPPASVPPPRRDWLLYQTWSVPLTESADPAVADTWGRHTLLRLARPDGSQERPIAEYGQIGDISPDGLEVVYQATIDKLTQLYRVAIDGRDRRQLTFGELPNFSFYPTWSPDGRRIAYTCSRRPLPGGMAYDLYVMNPDGTEPTCLLERDGDGGIGHWSPDSAEIATAVSEPPRPDGRPPRRSIVAVDVARPMAPPRVILHEEYLRIGAPDWGFDGRLAFAGYENNEREGGLYTVRADGSELTCLISGPALRRAVELTGIAQVTHPDAGGPLWSPDQSEIAFTYGQHAVFPVMIYNLAAGTVRPLARHVTAPHGGGERWVGSRGGIACAWWGPPEMVTPRAFQASRQALGGQS